MIAHIDERIWQKWMADTPSALRQKKLAQIERDFAAQGFPAITSDTGWIQVSTAGQSLAATIAFLEAAGVVAVTVQSDDVINWLGRNVVALAVKRALEMEGAESLGLALVEPEQLADALEAVQMSAINDQSTDAEEDGGIMEEIALHDMVAHGILTEEQIASSNRRNPFDVEDRRRVEIDSFGVRPDKDVSDFFPDGDDPWGN